MARMQFRLKTDNETLAADEIMNFLYSVAEFENVAVQKVRVSSSSVGLLAEVIDDADSASE